jgi:hypothetical protein
LRRPSLPEAVRVACSPALRTFCAQRADHRPPHRYCSRPIGEFCRQRAVCAPTGGHLHFARRIALRPHYSRLLQTRRRPRGRVARRE